MQSPCYKKDLFEAWFEREVATQSPDRKDLARKAFAMAWDLASGLMIEQVVVARNNVVLETYGFCPAKGYPHPDPRLDELIQLYERMRAMR